MDELGIKNLQFCVAASKKNQGKTEILSLKAALCLR